MAASYPLFPLPDLLLYPQAVLPLQFFEPRYVRMMRDMLDAGQDRLVLAALKPGFEEQYFEAPPCLEIAGLGRVMQVEEVPGPRFRLLVEGETRVRLLNEQPAAELPYRRVEVMPLTEPDARGEESDTLRADLRQVLESGTARLARPDEMTLGWLADVALMQLGAEAEERHRLFSLVDPLERARQVLAAWREQAAQRRRLEELGGADPKAN